MVGGGSWVGRIVPRAVWLGQSGGEWRPRDRIGVDWQLGVLTNYLAWVSYSSGQGFENVFKSNALLTVLTNLHGVRRSQSTYEPGWKLVITLRNAIAFERVIYRANVCMPNES